MRRVVLSIESPNADQARALLPDLTGLLRDSVESGASVGFVLPLADDVVDGYWRKVVADVEGEVRVLLVARWGERVVGAGQLALETRPNSAHRAEVQKVLVHTAARRQGIGRALMAALEAAARARGRMLLVLDTRAGDPAEHLYRAVGFTRAGSIPGYARSPDGSTLDATVFYYRQLSP